MSQSVFSLENLASWLEKQDPKKEYDYTNAHECVMTQYFEAFRIEKTGAFSYGPITLLENAYLGERETVWGNIAVKRPQTFGAALERTREEIENARIN